MHLASSVSYNYMIQEVKCAYSVYWIDDASGNESGHVLLFPFIDDLAFLYIITQYVKYSRLAIAYVVYS